jgi:hypothetical protein
MHISLNGICYFLAKKAKLDKEIDTMKKKHNGCLFLPTGNENTTVEQLLKTIVEYSEEYRTHFL